MHLPNGMTVQSLPRAASLNSTFGIFQTEFRQIDDHTIEFVREFNIPAQTIAAQQYREFSSFALQTEQAERQPVLLSKDPTEIAAGNPSSH